MSTEEMTTTTTSSNKQIDLNYVKTANGIICIVEGVLCQITLIMTIVMGSGGSVPIVAAMNGRGFMVFGLQLAAFCGFLQALVYFLINLFVQPAQHIPNYKPHGTLAEFSLSVIGFLFLLIAGIVLAVYTDRVTVSYALMTLFNGSFEDSFYGGAYIYVTAGFIFLCAGAYGVGSFFLFKDWISQKYQLRAPRTTV